MQQTRLRPVLALPASVAAADVIFRGQSLYTPPHPTPLPRHSLLNRVHKLASERSTSVRGWRRAAFPSFQVENAHLRRHLLPVFSLHAALMSNFPLCYLKLNARASRIYMDPHAIKSGALDVVNEPRQVVKKRLMRGRAADAASVWSSADGFSNYRNGNLL